MHLFFGQIHFHGGVGVRIINHLESFMQHVDFHLDQSHQEAKFRARSGAQSFRATPELPVKSSVAGCRRESVIFIMSRRGHILMDGNTRNNYGGKHSHVAILHLTRTLLRVISI